VPPHIAIFDSESCNLPLPQMKLCFPKSRYEMFTVLEVIIVFGDVSHVLYKLCACVRAHDGPSERTKYYFSKNYV
jgi:hypothetical protein